MNSSRNSVFPLPLLDCEMSSDQDDDLCIFSSSNRIARTLSSKDSRPRSNSVATINVAKFSDLIDREEEPSNQTDVRDETEVRHDNKRKRITPDEELQPSLDSRKIEKTLQVLKALEKPAATLTSVVKGARNTETEVKVTATNIARIAEISNLNGLIKWSEKKEDLSKIGKPGTNMGFQTESATAHVACQIPAFLEEGCIT